MVVPGVVLAEARQALGRLPAALDALVGDLDAASWRARPAPEEWAPVEIVCHLRDEEDEDFGARLRVVLAGGPRLSPIDPERWAVERHYREAAPEDALEALGRRRRANLDFLTSVAPEGLLASVALRDASRLSGLDLLVAWVAHDRLHLRQLAGTLARLWATRWDGLKADYAGPIPYEPGGSGR